jgi:hypothetical protein
MRQHQRREYVTLFLSGVCVEGIVMLKSVFGVRLGDGGIRWGILLMSMGVVAAIAPAAQAQSVPVDAGLNGFLSIQNSSREFFEQGVDRMELRIQALQAGDRLQSTDDLLRITSTTEFPTDFDQWLQGASWEVVPVSQRPLSPVSEL